MKMHKKIIAGMKWYIILYIDRKYPESCWANLVMWQIGAASFRETFGIDESRWNYQGCCEELGGACCDKCVRIGRLKE